MTTRIEIDLNCRVPGGTYAGFENCEGPVEIGQDVEVFESESGINGIARVTEIDAEVGLVYLSLSWSSLRP